MKMCYFLDSTFFDVCLSPHHCDGNLGDHLRVAVQLQHLKFDGIKPT